MSPEASWELWEPAPKCTDSSHSHICLEPRGVPMFLQQLESEEVTWLSLLVIWAVGTLSIHVGPFFLHVSSSYIYPTAGLDRELGHVVGVGWRMEGTQTGHLWFTIRQTQDNHGTGVHTGNSLQTVQAPGALKVKWVMGVQTKFVNYKSRLRVHGSWHSSYEF